MLFIISGPSGAGEDSIIQGLKKILPIEKVVTSTTRPPRADEQDGSDYYFLSPEAFRAGIAQDEFFEYACEYNGQYYGVSRKEIARVLGLKDKIGVWKIEYKGVLSAKELLPEVKSILITAPLSVLEDRIRARGGLDENQIKERLAYTKKWLKHKDIYDFTVENRQGELEQAVKETAKIIRAAL